MVLTFYYKDMLENVTMQIIQQFSAFFVIELRKNPVKCIIERLVKKLRLNAELLFWKYAYFSRTTH